MKNLFKLSYIVVLTLTALLVGACSNDYDYTGASVPDTQVYFDTNHATTIEVSKAESSFSLPVLRVNKAGELKVPLKFEAAEDNIFTVPESVTFADGDSVANIVITYNPDDVIYGTYTGGTITINDEKVDTIYGNISFTFKAGATEWADIPTNKSVGSYREDLIASLFGTDNYVYDVKIQKSIVNEGMYRMVNPYGAAFPENEEGDYDAENDYYWIIDATDPDAVWFDTFESGMNWADYGNFTFYSYVSYLLSKGNSLEVIKANRPDLFGTLKDGIITMPVKTMLTNMSGYDDGTGLYYGNSNGLLAVALPGYAIADYSVSAVYSGRFTDSKDVDYAVFNVTLSTDVASVKYALVPEGEDADAVADGIADGTIESETLTASGNINVAFDASGKYNLVMVVYNAKGEVVSTETFTVKLKSSKETAEVFNDITTGTVALGVKDLSALWGNSWGTTFGSETIEDVVLSQSTTDPTKFRLSPYLTDDHTLEFTMDADGIITFEEVEVFSTDEGSIFASDLVTFFGADSDNGKALINYGFNSHLDSESGIYVFNLAFYVAGGVYSYEQNTFTPSNAASANALKKAIQAARSSAKSKKVNLKGSKHSFKSISKNAKPVITLR